MENKHCARKKKALCKINKVKKLFLGCRKLQWVIYNSCFFTPAVKKIRQSDNNHWHTEHGLSRAITRIFSEFWMKFSL